jgi:hypothetical protein
LRSGVGTQMSMMSTSASDDLGQMRFRTSGM